MGEFTVRSTRLKRLDDQLRQVISETILTRVQDPRIGFVTVTRVQLSPEFDTARVFVTVYGDETVRADSMKGLRSAAPFVQSAIAKAIRLRRTPKLRFLYDDALDRSLRINATLRDLDDGGESPIDEDENADDPGANTHDGDQAEEAEEDA
jgi:ribosome-binding factor A